MAVVVPFSQNRPHVAGRAYVRVGSSSIDASEEMFGELVTRAGVENFRFHDLRHTFASHFVMRGGSLYDLKEILGHSDIKMTMRYAHLSPHHLHGSIAKVEGLARIPGPTAQRTAQNEPADAHEPVAGA